MLLPAIEMAVADPLPARSAARGLPEYRSQRLLDVAVAVLVAAAAVPVVAAAALLVRLTSRGPAFYTQVRLGVAGRPFRIVKLRTMYHNCEAESGVRWATPGDPRITPLGKVLRTLHVDELPQLWNVLCGEMSFVGPRPERPEIVAHLEEVIPGYRDRMAVRPGVTGLAQIQMASDTAVENVAEKLVYDRLYIARRGAGLDLRLLAGTALYLTGASYPRVARWAGLPTPAGRAR